MSYLIERMRLAGADEIRVVTRPEKSDVTDYARADKAVVIHAHPETVSASFVTGMRHLDDGDVVLLGFPDTVWGPRDGFETLVGGLTPEQRVVLGLFRTSEPQRSDIVQTTSAGIVTGVAVKPAKPRSSWLWGCAAAEAGALRGMEGFDEPGHFFDWLCKRRPVVGVELSDRWVDIGTKSSLERGEAVAEESEERPPTTRP